MKREPLINELRTLWSIHKAKRLLREEMRVRDRRAAGVILPHEAQEMKNSGEIPSWVYGNKQEV